MGNVNFSYKKRNAPLILANQKTITIRKRMQNLPKIGRTIHHFTGLRTKNCIKLGIAKLEKIYAVNLFGDGRIIIVLNNLIKKTDTINAERDEFMINFIKKDGFDSFSDWYCFFMDIHGLPFSGKAFEWTNFEPSYKAIIDLVEDKDDPLWWDDFLYPRYDKFHPIRMSNQYITKVVLIRVECSDCFKSFNIAIGSADKNAFLTELMIKNYFSLESPPLHQDGMCSRCLGCDMVVNSIELIELWEKINGIWNKIYFNDIRS